MVDRDPGLLQDRDHHVDETLRVRLVVVDDQHALRVQVIDRVVGVLRALDVVVGDDAEERRVLTAARQRRQRRRTGDERHPGLAEDRSNCLDLLAAGRADRRDRVGGDDRLRLLHRQRRRELGVVLGQRHVGVVGGIVIGDGELREVQLLEADLGHGTGERPFDRDRRGARLRASAARGGGRTRGRATGAAGGATAVAAPAARRDQSGHGHGNETDAYLHWRSNSSSWVLNNMRHADMTGGVPGYAGVPSG